MDKLIFTLFVYRTADGKHYAAWDQVPDIETITVVFWKKGDDMHVVRRSALGEARTRRIRHIVNLDDDRSPWQHHGQ